MINLSIFVVIQSQRAINREILIPQSQIKFNGNGVVNYECREDESAMLINQLIITELIVKISSLFGSGFA